MTPKRIDELNDAIEDAKRRKAMALYDASHDLGTWSHFLETCREVEALNLERLEWYLDQQGIKLPAHLTVRADNPYVAQTVERRAEDAEARGSTPRVRASES